MKSNVTFFVLIALAVASIVYACSTVWNAINLSYARDFAIMEGLEWTEVDREENKKAYSANKVRGILSFLFGCACLMAASLNRKTRRVEKYIKDYNHD